MEGGGKAEGVAASIQLRARTIPIMPCCPKPPPKPAALPITPCIMPPMAPAFCSIYVKIARGEKSTTRANIKKGVFIRGTWIIVRAMRCVHQKADVDTQPHLVGAALGVAAVDEDGLKQVVRDLVPLRHGAHVVHAQVPGALVGLGGVGLWGKAR